MTNKNWLKLKKLRTKEMTLSKKETSTQLLVITPKELVSSKMRKEK